MYHRQRNPFNEANKNVLGGVSGNAGTATLSNQTMSLPCWMGDFAQISVQVANNSVVTIYGTNSALWTTAFNSSVDSSVITSLSVAGVYKVEPGFDWAQFQRSTSTQTVFYVGQSRR